MQKMKHPFSLEGRIALVTGASSGIGAKTASLLAELGASVVCAARRKNRIDEVADSIETAGGRALALALDVTDRDAIPAALEEIEASLGIVDLLVNCAGITGTPGAYATYDEDDWQQVVDVNLNAVHRLSQAVARRLIDAGRGGAIVNVASIASVAVAKNFPAYFASKAGMSQLSRAMALDLIQHGIRVNIVCPGAVESEIFTPERLATEAGLAMIKTIPRGRVGRAEDIAWMIAFLASPAADFIVGEQIVVDGGQSIQIPGH
jgi:NAD(P)-dependent dehydrogenase (short-subunit alcohol dehydrogenase family)